MKNAYIFTALLALTSLPAMAAPQTVTLSVPGMTCPTCPITIRTALNRVDGVEEVEVRYEEREITVRFEDTETSVDALTAATTNAGFPSSEKTGAEDEDRSS